MRFLRYDWAGAALGLLLPLVATFIAVWDRRGSLIAGALAVQAAEPLLWLIDTAPIVLGALGFAVERQRRLVGAQQEKIAGLELQRRVSLERTASELSGTAQNLLADVSSLGSASAQMTASVRETIETMASLSHGATAAVLAAETVAGRALDVASKATATVEELAATLKTAAGGAKEIARIAQDQMDGIEQVLAAMNEIHFATEASSRSTREIAAEAQVLSKHARKLRRAIACGAGSRGAGFSPRNDAEDERGEQPAPASHPSAAETTGELELGSPYEFNGDAFREWSAAAPEEPKASCAG